MSIIQEALKKVGKPEVPREEKKEVKSPFDPQINKQGPDKKIVGPKHVYYVIIAVFLIILAGIVMKASRSTPDAAVHAPAARRIEPILPKIEKREAPVRSARRRENIGEFVLNGIMYLVDGPRAIINDIIVGEGETVGGAKVEKIKKDSVLLKYNDSEVNLNINK